ncbi:CobW HypB UreG nucleotide binding domain [Trypanosoma vivax]|nr:CobW HypB UreG nucleotide binding domain [Trypanosoma vivax]
MSDDECPELVSARVPVTILTGFLGSCKMTLLHYVLSAEHSLRIAVIVNEFEFGKSIEKGLTLKSSQKPDDEWLELNNGCMCCTAQTQTVKALEGLMQSKGTFDLVLVETSGLADPSPVAAMFWQDESLCGSLYLSSNITVVDAKNSASILDVTTRRRSGRGKYLLPIVLCSTSVTSLPRRSKGPLSTL